jgi:indolepyruvate ferredoxin oxidoreductase
MRDITLDHRYAAHSGQILATGIQALARAPLDIARRDAALGLHTAGFISGYRGSPLGGYDQELSEASSFLKQHNVVFQPGVNEELAATAVWGTQQVNFLPGAKYDGVFGIWYGKAPGVDRSLDPMRHANFAGTWDKGGVLVLAGDDPECKSSTLPNQSEFGLIHAEIPVLNPSDVQEVLDFSVIGIAMSRYSGCWVSVIASTDNMDSHAVIDVGVERYAHLPTPKPASDTDLHIRPNDAPLAQETRMRNFKLPAVLSFARAAGVNRTVIKSPHPRLGIVATGRAFSELMQALQDLKLDADTTAGLGISVLKIGMPWPLDVDAMREFATSLGEILVVEDKRPLLESQIKDALYDLPTDQRPRVIGKLDAKGKPLLSQTGVLTAVEIAAVVAQSLPRNVVPFAELKQKLGAERASTALETRDPFYCSGCPHNRSTKVLPGSHALAGIGCHYMARWNSPATTFFSQMGGEGIQWLGQARFTETPHIFANLGDGTYFHSGLLAIRQAVAAKARITYKILYNDAVAMTGGQKVDGGLDVAAITRQLRAEGVERIAIVAEDPSRYDGVTDLAPGVAVHPRDTLQTVEGTFRDTHGVTAIIYDQMCAAEKRRRRKRGLLADPAKRVFINELVCEGCGDCSAKSNCISVEPIDTELGRKRRINQSSCNKDLSCVDGFCPSFVTVTGGELRRIDNAGLAAEAANLPRPRVIMLNGAYNILVSGIGGLGVTTLAAILAMAAHLDERRVRTLNRTGLAQKGGAVASHVRIASHEKALAVPAIPVGEMDVHLAYDMIVATSPNAISRSSQQRTYTLLNTHINPTSAFVRDTAKTYNAAALETKLRTASHELQLIDARDLAEAFLGNELYANTIMLGYALQKGLLPVTLDAVWRAIDMNGAAQKQNKVALAIGRLAAGNPVWLMARRQQLTATLAPRPAQTLDEAIATRTVYLTAYQNTAYAKRYSDLVSRVGAHELDGHKDLTEAVARGAFAAMMIKDEYEVARLLTDPAFADQMKAVFSGNFKLSYNLAPSWLARTDKTTGEPRKIKFGPWLTPVLKMIAALKRLRGTPADVFAFDPVHRAARAFRDEYLKTMSSIITGLTPTNYAIAVDIAKLPLGARGYGHIKAKAVATAQQQLKDLTAKFQNAPAHQPSHSICRAG